LKKISQYFLFIIAVQILNISIDNPSVQLPSSGGEFNYIDSYVEYVAEVVLKYENAIPESKSRQQKDMQIHKHIQVICQALKLPLTTAPEMVLLKNLYPYYLQGYAYRYFQKINPPPPKFV